MHEPPSPTLTSYSAVFAVSGMMRRVFIEAENEAEARDTCRRWNVGFEGKAAPAERAAEPQPEAYDSTTARRLLGGISRTSLYKELVLGNLQRLPGTRRVLITRTSLERRCRRP